MQLPYAQLPVRADGSTDQPWLDAAVRVAAEPGVTDVLVLAHGWNETPGAAFGLYTALSDQLVTLLAQRPAIDRRFAVVGVVWPSLKWADDIPVGGALAVAPDETAMLHDTIRTGIEDPAVQDQLQRQVAGLGTTAGRAAFVAALRQQLPPAGELSDDDALPSVVQHGDAEELFGAMEGAAPDTLPSLLDGPLPEGPMPDGPPSDLGGGAAFHLTPSDLNPISIARQLVNLTSYYQMKDRAGRVGAGAGAQLLQAVRAAGPQLGLHLAGHSFGARVVAGAATASSSPVHSVVLLQGAFSHLAFAPGSQAHKSGAFRGALVNGVTGPIVDTHTHRDLAVFVAYAVASRLARQSGDGLGGADDPYGGIGANGAVETPEAVDSVDLSDVEARYSFAAGHIHNLRADRFISGHTDIRGPQVANALLQAMLAPTA